MEFRYFSRNGELRPIAEADISLANIEYQYGFGVYETLRISKGVPYFAREHIERLLESARVIGLQHSLSAATIAQSIAELIKKNEVDICNAKILLIGGKTAADATISILCLNPLFPDKKLYRDGVHTITVQHERGFPHAKTLSMLGSYLAFQKARSLGAYDALLVDRAGNIVEGTRTNFFCIHDKTIFSPPEEKILLGVTRKAVLKVAAERGYKLWEGDIPLAHIADYDGAFLTSTSSNILPIKSIDTFTFPAIPSTLGELMPAFDKYLDDCGGKM
ncbi:MAG: putative branched-chain-amino-acid aminotransferase IlvE [Candidatus Parcubacteria bacterium]|jgi:branched-subunit amino acid aminotransferase/4-amino-4-deoxychorismate lyase